MRSSYIEATERAAPPPEWPARLLRLLTIPFAIACVVFNARMIQIAGLGQDNLQVLMRSVLLEVETYLAILAILMSFQILPVRSAKKTPPSSVRARKRKSQVHRRAPLERRR